MQKRRKSKPASLDTLCAKLSVPAVNVPLTSMPARWTLPTGSDLRLNVPSNGKSPATDQPASLPGATIHPSGITPPAGKASLATALAVCTVAKASAAMRLAAAAVRCFDRVDRLIAGLTQGAGSALVTLAFAVALSDTVSVPLAFRSFR